MDLELQQSIQTEKEEEELKKKQAALEKKEKRKKKKAAAAAAAAEAEAKPSKKKGIAAKKNTEPIDDLDQTALNLSSDLNLTNEDLIQSVIDDGEEFDFGFDMDEMGRM